MNLKKGVVLQKGKYTIDSILGEGVFCITYRAIHHQSNQIVVLKTLNESLYYHQDFAKFQHQFRAEVHLLANSQHPNIVKVWDLFEEDELFFMVMDYIPGQNLAELIQSGHNLHPNQAVHYIHQVALALSVVHKNGFLHRDIQPKNIIRRAGTNTVVLTDFGIACDLTPGIKQTHTNLFSVGYAPPEQSDPQQKLTPATDIYALTATLYFLLTGKAPTPAPLRLTQAVPQVIRFSTQELKLFPPNFVSAIENTIVKGLELEAQKRPQTIAQWLVILLKQSNIIEVNNQNKSPTEGVFVVSNNEKIMEINSDSHVKNRLVKSFPKKTTNQAVSQRNIEHNHFRFCSNSYFENKFSWINQLSLQLMIVFLFGLTAATFGWIGFEITLRYSHTKNNKKMAFLRAGNLLETLKNESNYNFRNHNPSIPLFDSPSVKSYSVTPPQLNKLPKPSFDQDDVLPNSGYDYNKEKSWSEKPYYPSDFKTQIPSYNYSSNEAASWPEKSYYPFESQFKYPRDNSEKYQQQNQYPDDYY